MAVDPRAIALITLGFALCERRRTECQAERGRVHSLATPVARPKRLFEFPMRTFSRREKEPIRVALQPKKDWYLPLSCD